MRARLVISALLCLMTAMPHAGAAAKKKFRFGILAQVAAPRSDRADFGEELAKLNDEKLVFVVTNGVKSAGEPCSDELYTERRAAFANARNAVIPSLTASDWTQCVNSSGKPAAAERLNRVRELFFAEPSSFGDHKIPLIRQSITPKFRSYSENSRWRIRNVLFATVHLPANNNNFAAQAGRNSEFEDRLIANRDWLQKLFLLAKRKKMDGIVLFCDGNPLALPDREKTTGSASRDGFLEVRRQLLKLSGNYAGKVLLVHRQPRSQAGSTGIRWSRNLGDMGIAPGLSRVTVNAGPSLFLLESQPGKKPRSPRKRP